MSATGIDPAPVEQRLLAAERAIRRLRALAWFLIVGFAVLLAWQLAPRTGSVSAQGFELRDRAWRRRGSLTLRDDGSPALRLDNASGRARAMLNVRNDGSVVLRLSDEHGHNRAILALEADGRPRLQFTDRDGRTLCALEVGEGNEPRMTLRDSSRRVVWTAP
ncbi:MAG TPA: hypothetical protein VEY91_08040 [Candidatus Limnocylindria bacterium]|nr:hypothetical protein [Candidatus Limnocylindria bacterium]